MSQTKEVKDYYAILGVNHNATEAEIEEAYNKLAVEHHPKKTQKQGLEAQKKFKDVGEAFKILKDKHKRAHYDNLIKGQFSLDQALKTFESFYNQFGIENEEEKQFFEENYHHITKNYYDVLGVSRHASVNDIKQAYRKLALKYHPKKNRDDEEIKKKFIEISEAYQALSEEKQRQTYNDITFRALHPIGAHDVFEQFFSHKPFGSSQDEQFFRPLMETRWIKNLDKLMNDELHCPNHQNSESRRVHEVYSNKNGVQTRKVVKQNKRFVDGKLLHEIEEEYQLPNGDKEVRKTIDNGEKVDKKVYHLKRGEDLPKEIENGKSCENGNHCENGKGSESNVIV